jgi:hypothetical protein
MMLKTKPMIYPKQASGRRASLRSATAAGFSRAGIIALVAGVLLLSSIVFLFTQNRALHSELERLRAENQEVQQLRETQEELQSLRNQMPEMERLRKDSQELLRLRNEARQFREQKEQLAKLTAENEKLRAGAQQLQQRFQQLSQAELQRQQAPPPQPVETITPPPLPGAQDREAAGCLKNLRQLAGATEQWALETRKTPQTPVTWNDIAPYFSAVPACPAGGSYSLGSVGDAPQCSIPGHQLPQQ